MHVENWDRWDLFLFIQIWHNYCHKLQRNMTELRYLVACTRVFFFILYPRDGGSIFFQNVTKFLPLHNIYSHRSEKVKSDKISLYLTGMFEGEAKLARHTPLFVWIMSLHITCRQQSLTGSRIVSSSEQPESFMAALKAARVWTISPVCKLKI